MARKRGQPIGSLQGLSPWTMIERRPNHRSTGINPRGDDLAVAFFLAVNHSFHGDQPRGDDPVLPAERTSLSRLFRLLDSAPRPWQIAPEPAPVARCANSR